jgi:protoporphyrin/coproporphyrin ferrochelatase
MPEVALEAQRRAVLLLAHGTPSSLDQIPEYLRNITSGRPMPESVVEEIRHRYSLIGSSPLTELTLQQGSLLSQALGLPVYVGMRNWKPYIADVVRQMREDGITSAVAICLAPQNSRTSVGLYRRAAFAEAAGTIEMDFIDGWSDHPMLAQAFAERLQPVWQSLSARIGSVAPVLFTAHSVPCRTIQTQPASEGHPAGARPESRPELGLDLGPDPYPVEAKHTAANVAALLAPHGLTAADWFFAFQSQGMSGASWIGPTVEATLTALRQEGHTAVVIAPIGFLCDHVEILYDIDIGFRDFAAGIGLEVVRPQSLNESPLLTAALEQLAREGFARLAAKTPSRSAASPVPAV